jgi:hypothetical protein
LHDGELARHSLRTVVSQARRDYGTFLGLAVDASVGQKSRMPMKTVRDYLHHAEECDALAAGAKTQQEREMIIHIAETWRMLAETREQQILRHRETAATLSDSRKGNS